MYMYLGNDSIFRKCNTDCRAFIGKKFLIKLFVMKYVYVVLVVILFGCGGSDDSVAVVPPLANNDRSIKMLVVISLCLNSTLL